LTVLTVSIVIVNYNVKYFLEQCLHSLRKSAAGISAEVIVFDNQSADGSIDYLKPRFPEVQFIISDTNLGFAKASNKGAGYAKGKYILFLNPDTLLSEDTLEKCIDFFEQNKEAGALGVKMIDGTGRFLKESKRSFPSPFTSLYKLFGLSNLFPHSKIFNRYYAGHLDNNKNHEVDVLAGAFMMVRREVLDKLGSFDEQFFMYGEDIDLSYRIQKAGYKNYYLAETETIHFKGESTRRGSFNYVRLFYTAMSIFVKKHYGGTRAGMFNAALHFAIWLRAGIAAIGKFIRWIGLPFIDAILILLSFWVAKEIWSTYIKPETVYSNKLLLIAFPVYTFLYLTVAYYAGLYNRSYRRSELIRSMLIATLVLLAGYALLPEYYRFSRGILLLGTLLGFVLINSLRWMMVQGKLLQKPADKISKPYILAASNPHEFESIKNFLEKNGLENKLIGRLAIDHEENAVAPLKKVNEIAVTLGAEEILFCIGQLSYKQVFQYASSIKTPLRLRFHAVGSCSIVGSDSDASNGEAITSEANFNLEQPNNRRIKRLIDVVTACILLVIFPLHFILVKNPFHLLKNCISVLAGKKTWIGYNSVVGSSLPRLRTVVISVNGTTSEKNENRIDYWYAKNYEPSQDVRLIIKNYKQLGR
jgi:GT2 family glycosyltransferase